MAGMNFQTRSRIIISYKGGFLMGSIGGKAGNGIYYLFIGQILGLLGFIPILGIVAVLASFIICLYAIYILSGVSEDYKTAFFITIINLAVNIIGMFFNHGIISGMLSMANTILSFLSVFYICKATAGILWGVDQTLVSRAGLIWKLYGLCMVVMLICELLMYIPIINILASIVTFIIAIIQLVAGILYLMFLWQSQKVLRR